MIPSKHIDRVIYEKVLKKDPEVLTGFPPRYTLDPRAALSIVPELKGYDFELEHKQEEGWYAYFKNNDERAVAPKLAPPSTTPELAICKAALDLAEVKV